MFIFYDFETSSRELLGQILNYAFVVTDKQLNPVSELSGYIRLNPTQLPEIEAILVNKINVDWLQANGQSEREAASEIFTFLQTQVSKYGPCVLAGFNSNSFDLGFLRNLLISYGYNPYFEGKLGNKDVLHFAQFLAFQNPDDFPWVRVTQNDKTYYSFTLEDLCTSFSLLEGVQTHQAKDDVYLTILLTRTLEQVFSQSFWSFSPLQLLVSKESQAKYQIGTVKQRDFVAAGETPRHFVQTPMLCLAKEKKTTLFVNLAKYTTLKESGTPLSSEEKLSCIVYINENKHFFILNPLPFSEIQTYDEAAEDIFQDPFFGSFAKKPTLYFDAIKKPWDISYQIHELGFDRIDELKTYVDELMENPGRYSERLKALMAKRRMDKDTFLIQLYNRVYLNFHPNPDQALFRKYCEARYKTGVMLRNPEALVPIEDQIEKIRGMLAGAVSEAKRPLLEALLRYFEGFHKGTLS